MELSVFHEPDEDLRYTYTFHFQHGWQQAGPQVAAPLLIEALASWHEHVNE
jgi:hypothetical protein